MPVHITQLDAEGLAFIKRYEGFSAIPYLDSADIPTIGYGSTFYEDGTRVKLTDPAITRQRADELYSHELQHYEASVDSFTRDDITQNNFNALVSFAYNEGPEKLKTSHLLIKVNNNPKDPTIRQEFDKWVYAAGKKLNGLITRRAAEADLYFS